MVGRTPRPGVMLVDQQLRLADLLAALSVATDLGMGQPPEKANGSQVGMGPAS